MKGLTVLLGLVLSVAFPAAGASEWTVAKGSTSKFELPIREGRLTFELVPGRHPQGVSMRFEDGAEQPVELKLQTWDQSFPYKQKDGKTVRHNWTNSCVRLWGCGEELRLYTMTHVEYNYRNDQIPGIVTNETAYGDRASEHVFHVDVRHRGGEWQVWIDRNLAKSFPAKARTGKLVLATQEKCRWRRVTGETFPDDPLIERLPHVAPFAVRNCAENLGSWACENDGYRNRSPYDRMPDAYLRRVPVGSYAKARVTCALGGDTNLNTKVTARVTRFRFGNVTGRAANAMATQTREIVRVPGQEKYVVEFDLDCGQIQDLVHQSGFEALDFEVLGGVKSISYVADGQGKPAAEKSDVIVLDAELIRSPASMWIRNGTHANLFYADTEPPTLTAELGALAAGMYRVDWTLRDVAGKTLRTATDRVTLAAGATNAVPRTFAGLANGWYGVTTDLLAADGTRLVRRESSFVVIPPDNRKAGYESPYFTWMPTTIWYSPKPEVYGPWFDVVKRCGIRRGTVWWLDEEKLKPWGLTCNPLGYPSAYRMSMLPEKTRVDACDKIIREQMAKFPHADWVTVFHENYSGPEPQELYGGTTKVDGKQAALDKEHVRIAEFFCERWRANKPDVKFMVGNSGDSRRTIAELLRGGIKKEYLDRIGDEDPCGPGTPEMSVAGNFYALRYLAGQYGYDVPAAACFEWKFRPRRLFDNDRQLGAIGVRDALVAHAWRSPSITVWTAPEPGYSYYTSSWGCGAFSRPPLLQPYPLAASVCTLTRVLDCAEFVRRLDTGSQSAYCLEFRRREPAAYVYALWTAHGWTKGTVETDVRSVLRTGCYGDEKELTSCFGLGKVTVETEVGEEPVYLTMERPLKSVVVSTGDRTYPLDTVPPSDRRVDLDVSSDVKDWVADPGEMHTRMRQGCVTGAFEMHNAVDPEKGRVVEVELKTDRPLKSPLLKELCFVRPSAPVTLPADAHTLGVWIKGNSCGGKIYFEITDRTGQKWVTAGQYGGGLYDQPEMMTLNYDGWRLVPFALTEVSPVVNRSRNWHLRQWVRELPVPVRAEPPCPPGPFKLRAVGFGLRRETLMLSDLEPTVSQKVQIGGIVAWR